MVMAEPPAKSPDEPARQKAGDQERIVRRFKRGDTSAFDRIVADNYAEIAALANRLLGWPGDIEDVAQDVFLAAYVGLKRFRCDCSLKTWLFKITINKCRTYRYKRMLHLGLSQQAIAQRNGLARDAEEKQNTHQERFLRVRQAVKALPAKYREAVVLRYLQELSSREVCELLGISSSALQVRLHRARNRLRVQIGELIEE